MVLKLYKGCPYEANNRKYNMRNFHLPALPAPFDIQPDHVGDALPCSLSPANRR
jgi:hypothetical protein